MEKTRLPRYLLLITAEEWNHDADEWIGIYFNEEELRIAYEQTLTEFESERKKGHYHEAQKLTIIEFIPNEMEESEGRRYPRSYTCEQRIREVGSEELPCFQR